MIRKVSNNYCPVKLRASGFWLYSYFVTFLLLSRQIFQTKVVVDIFPEGASFGYQIEITQILYCTLYLFFT